MGLDFTKRYRSIKDATCERLYRSSCTSSQKSRVVGAFSAFGTVPDSITDQVRHSLQGL